MFAGVLKAIEKLGVEYTIFDYPIRSFEEDALFEEELHKALRKKLFSAVFSINFFPIISNVCERMGIKYISWSYDSPIKETAWKSLKNSCNYIYDFDRGQVETFHKNGISNAFHLPLAVDTDIFFRKIKNSIGDSKFTADVSFVGKLYTSDYPKFLGILNEYMKGYIESCVHVQQTMMGTYIIPEILSDKTSEDIIKEFKKKISKEVSRGQIEYLLAQEAVRRNRVLALSLLCKHCKTVLFSPDIIENAAVELRGPVDYDNEMPLVFYNSKINLNISFNAIRTGIPLRALDIMGCKGFLISNPQEELLEYFKVGEECEVFSSTEELMEKTNYYLKNAECREKIAKKGFEKIKKNFTFEERMKSCLN